MWSQLVLHPVEEERKERLCVHEVTTVGVKGVSEERGRWEHRRGGRQNWLDDARSEGREGKKRKKGGIP